VNVRAALIALFKESQEWRHFLKSCCERSTLRLSVQSWQFRDELRDRGHHFPAEEMEDALLGLARDLLPQSTAAKWDADWAHDLCKSALATLASHYATLSAEEKKTLNLSVQEVWDERMTAASLANYPVAFREAVKGWQQAGLEAMNKARAKGGAA
jgi:hypothetical protein